MSNNHLCPICGPIYGGFAEQFRSGIDGEQWECEICGRFLLAGTTKAVFFENTNNKLSPIKRAAISYMLNRRSDKESEAVLTTDKLREFTQRAKLPTAGIQAVNFINIIGDHVSDHGVAYVPNETTIARVGVLDPQVFLRLKKQLIEAKLIVAAEKKVRKSRNGGDVSETSYDLTLEGWEKYYAEKKGEVQGNYGFVALQFGDAELDDLLNNNAAPAIKEQLGYELYDMRALTEAGVIDNIMREKIRESAFVLADLTHENRGAYWEAGYGEGLGKPVIYLCEKAKFDQLKTHFDTNHCTTICWSKGDEEKFVESLIATIKRSLGRI